MDEPMKIRASMKGDAADIKCLMNHVMETGLRKDPDTGRAIPARHIKDVTVTVSGKTVLNAQWGGGISKNPYLAIKVKGAKLGESVTVSWQDTTGETRAASTTIG